MGLILWKKISSFFVIAAMASSALAASQRLDITWSGASFGNSATATGFITFDSLLSAPGSNNFNSAITDAGITITGAASGNGTFGMTDFSSFYFYSPSTLDFSSQLIGQHLTNGSTFGATNGSGGDLNFFGSSSGSPIGSNYFKLTTNVGSGDSMLVTSMAPVPEPETYAMLLAGLGILGGIARRHKKKHSVA